VFQSRDGFSRGSRCLSRDSSGARTAKHRQGVDITSSNEADGTLRRYRKTFLENGLIKYLE